MAAADRQQVKRFKFTVESPGKATGVKTAVRFPAADPNRAVEKIVTKLARGTELDTGVPERCRASDEELRAEGPSACPRSSRVGEGIIEGAELGVGDLTLLNAKRETIFVTEFRDRPIRVVGRESAEGRKQVIEIPAGFTLERVRLEIDRIKRNGESYVETPDRCPPSEAWINRGRFVYRDGVERRERLAAPCERRPG